MHRILRPPLRLLAISAIAGFTTVGASTHALADFYLGQIVMFASDFCPKDFYEANGNLLAISQNQALFSILGVRYGGDGVNTFALPKLAGQAQGAPGSRTGIALTVCINVRGVYPSRN
jgi:microcystin-dependent protein